MALPPITQGLPASTHNLLRKAGAQKHTLTAIMQEAIGKENYFRDSKVIQRLSCAVSQISMHHLVKFLSDFRKVLQVQNLDNDVVTFMVADEKIDIPRAIVIAFSTVWATNLTYETKDQTNPIYLLKKDELGNFNSDVLVALLNFLKTSEVNTGVELTFLILAADAYGIPSLRLAIHDKIKFSKKNWLNWLNFSCSKDFIDHVPNRHLRTVLLNDSKQYGYTPTAAQLNSKNAVGAFLRNRDAIIIENNKLLNRSENSTPILFYQSDRQIKLQNYSCNIEPSSLKTQKLINLTVESLRRSTLPQLSLDSLKGKDITTLFSKLSEVDITENGLVFKHLSLHKIELSKKLATSLKNLFAKQACIEKLTLDNCWTKGFDEVGIPIPFKLTIINPNVYQSQLPLLTMQAHQELRKFSYQGVLDEKTNDMMDTLQKTTSLYSITLNLRCFNSYKLTEFNEPNAKALSTIISSNTQLMKFSASLGKCNTAALNSILTSLKNATSLTSLDIWDSQLENVESLADLISVCPISTLRLDSNRISDISHLVRNTSLKHLSILDLRNNSLGDSGAKSIASMNLRLLKLDLSYNGISVTGMKLIANMLQTNSILQHLWLGNLCGRYEKYHKDVLENQTNEMDDFTAETFAKSLRLNSTLLTLDLPGSCNQKGAEDLANALKFNTSLQKLNVFQVIINPNLANPFKDNKRFIGNVGISPEYL